MTSYSSRRVILIILSCRLLLRASVFTVLPAATVPVMRQTQKMGLVIGTTDGLVRQGDDIMFKVTARNYGAAGNVGVILWMENVDKPEETYLSSRRMRSL